MFTKKYWLSWKKIGEGVLKDLNKTEEEEESEREKKNKKKWDVGDLINDY